MKKFIILHYGFVEPTKEIMDGWHKWFKSIEENTVDAGSAFGPGREITKDGTKDLTLGKDSVTGYTIIRAKDLDEAEKLAKSLPFITGTRVYEAKAM